VGRLGRELGQHDVDRAPDVDALDELPLSCEELLEGDAQLCTRLAGQAGCRARGRLARLHADRRPIEGDQEVAERGLGTTNHLIAAPTRRRRRRLELCEGEVRDDEGVGCCVVVDAEDVEAPKHTELALQAVCMDYLEVYEVLCSAS